VYVAAFFPLSGSLSYFGITCLQAAELAAQNINNYGGLKGANITIISVDTTSSSTQAYSIVQNFLSTHKNISAAVGLYSSGLTLPVLPLFQKYQIPLIFVAFSNIATSLNYTYGFRIAPNATVFGNTMYNFLLTLKSMGFNASRVAIIYDNDAYGAGVAQAVQADVSSNPFYQVVSVDPYSTSNFTSAGPIVEAVQAAKPQIILEASYLNDSTLIVEGLRQAGLNIPIIGGSGGFPLPQFYSQVGNYSNLIFTAAAYNAYENKSLAMQVNAQYEQKYGYFMPEAAGAYYQAVIVIADAINLAHSANPVTIDETLHTSTFPGGILPENEIHFNSIGTNVDAEPVIVQWQNGTLYTVYPSNLATSKIIIPPYPNYT
ncbi:MAG: ABC transporter substrate-binding protein, partial [Nitrososphaerota archaeon]|nr:ABC transporter substrate-binding protein [Nitrososphaerota archaeon]